MALRFSEADCEVESQVGTRDFISVTIALAPAHWRAVSEALGEISNREGSELRTDFPGGWTVFWKIRDGDSRFFVAHPGTHLWVATLAVSANHLAMIRERLEHGSEGALSELEAVSKVSNVEVKVRVRRESPE